VGAAWTAAQGAQPHSTVHQSLIRFFLRDLDNVRNPSYSLVAVKMGHGGPAVMAWFGQTSTVVIAPSGFGQTSTAVIAPSGGSPAPRITSVAMVWVGGGGGFLLHATNPREGLR
jgi:hypothetical protein